MSSISCAVTGTTIVVVEVKSRHGSRFGTALESIGPLKARRLRGAALWWLSDHGMLMEPIRFDAVVVSLDGAGAPLALQHVRDVIEGGG